MKLVELLFELYEADDIKIDVFGIASYNASAIVELQGLLGHLDINRVEASTAFAALTAHHNETMARRDAAIKDFLGNYKREVGISQ